MPGPSSPANCLACRYFYITYEPNHPYGCRALSFKSKELPSRVVYASSGLECQSFSPKVAAPNTK